MLTSRCAAPVFRCGLPISSAVRYSWRLGRKPIPVEDIPIDVTAMVDKAEMFPLQTANPVFDKRGRYQPQFYEAIEMFFDKVVIYTQRESDARGDWSPMHKQGPLFHWKESQDKNGVTRIKVQDEKYEKHIEIHWDHWFLLAYQHVPRTNIKKENPLDSMAPLDILRSRKEIAVIEKMLLEDLPKDSTRKLAKFPELKTYGEEPIESYHFGQDIPEEWMMAFKSTKWPKSFVPRYIDEINYFDAFRRSNLIDSLRKHSYMHIPDNSDNEASHIRNLQTHLRLTDPEKYGKIPLRRDQREELAENPRYRSAKHFDEIFKKF